MPWSARQNAPLRRSYLEFPWPRLYEHPWMNCALAIERTYQGEDGVFVGIFRAPEQQSLVQIQQALSWYKNEPLEKVGFYRQALRFSRVPTPVRRMFWWVTLNISGYKRCKRFGTFGLSSYGNLGAENLHPISPLTTTLTYGPIDPATGQVVVKLIYDHRVLDGAYIARRLRDIEDALKARSATSCGSTCEGTRDHRDGPPPNVEPLLKPHLPTTRPGPRAGRARPWTETAVIARLSGHGRSAIAARVSHVSRSPTSWSVVTRTSSRLISFLAPLPSS